MEREIEQMALTDFFDYEVTGQQAHKLGESSGLDGRVPASRIVSDPSFAADSEPVAMTNCWIFYS